MRGEERTADTLEMLMIEPPSGWSFMTACAACDMKKAEVRFSWITFSISDAGHVAESASGPPPALLTTTSSPP